MLLLHLRRVQNHAVWREPPHASSVLPGSLRAVTAESPERRKSSGGSTLCSRSTSLRRLPIPAGCFKGRSPIRSKSSGVKPNSARTTSFGIGIVGPSAIPSRQQHRVPRLPKSARHPKARLPKPPQTDQPSPPAGSPRPTPGREPSCRSTRERIPSSASEPWHQFTTAQSFHPTSSPTTRCSYPSASRAEIEY